MRISLIVFCFSILMVPLYSAEKEPEDKSVILKSSKESWQIGVSEFQWDSKDPSLSWLSVSLALHLKEALGICTDHILTDEEKNSLRTRLYDKQVKSGTSERDGLVRNSDKKKFFNFDTYDPSSDLKNINEKNESLSILNDKENVVFELPEELPIVFSDYGESGLYSAESPVQFWLGGDKNDYLIKGYLTGLDEYTALDLFVYSAWQIKPLFESSWSFSKNDTEWVVSEMSRELRNVILGRPWAEVSFSTVPENSLISLNGELSGQHEKYLVEPGSYELEINSSGYLPVKETLVLAENEQILKEVELIKVDEDTVLVNSIPEGCEVFYQSQSLGKTPLQLKASETARILYIKKPGYISRQIQLKSDKQILEIEMEPLIKDPDLLFKEKRKEYYKSLGWASLSYTLPFFLFGLSDDYANAYNLTGSSLDYSRQQNLKIAGWVSLGITGILTTRMLYKLADMIKAAGEILH